MQDILMPMELRDINIGGFWQQQIKRLMEKWIPHCIRQLEPGGAGQEFLNLVNAAKAIQGRKHEKFIGKPWGDAYVYNTVEAICLALSVNTDGDSESAHAREKLQAKLQEWIPVILAAQMPDGYIHSFHTINGYARYSNIHAHEFYVMGYFLEMGVAHYKATGGNDTRLYEAAIRCADHLEAVFGPAPKRTWTNGHAGLEYALCRLGCLASETGGAGAGDKYVQLAKHFLNHQHETECSPYNQSHMPAVEMSEARGHAVRATYFYTAMADMALLTRDTAFRKASDRIWANAIHRKHYLTGGVGASHKGEAFSGDFDLPNDGYCESCAGCGMSFWAQRMHRIHHDAHYCDVQERVLYNNLAGSLDLSGEKFFYENPLASDKLRSPWSVCPCCVGNIPRTLIAIKDLMYASDRGRNTLYLSHFVDSEAFLGSIAGRSLAVSQATDYPWEGDITITLHPADPAEFSLKIRIPNRTESELYTATPDLSGAFALSVNGEPLSPHIDKGYVEIRRLWKPRDKIVLSLPMDVQRVRCDRRVSANHGRVALQRGPLVYCVEDSDHDVPVQSLRLRKDQELQAIRKRDLLGSAITISGGGIRAIPYFLRLNRDRRGGIAGTGDERGGYSQVWIAEEDC